MSIFNRIMDLIAGKKTKEWYETEIKALEAEKNKLQQRIDAKKRYLKNENATLLRHSQEKLKVFLSRAIRSNTIPQDQIELAFEIVKLIDAVQDINYKIAELQKEKKERYPTIH